MRFNTLESTKADQLDFIPRDRRGHLRKLILAFVGVGAAILLLAYWPALRPVSGYTELIALFLLALLGYYVTSRAQMDLDLVLATEFQNMLFSSSLNIGQAFVMLVRRDGSIVHISEGFSDVFPEFNYAESQALEGVFEQGTVRKTDRERILNALYSSTPEHLIFPVVSKYRPTKDYIITVEPLARPVGFSLIRGREYLGQRTATQPLTDDLSATSIDKLDHLLTTTPVAHYTTDQYGRFEYVNPAFEHLFGYDPGEIVSNKLSLHHLFFSFGGQALTEEYTIGDYTGDAAIVTKDGGRQHATVQQQTMRDSNGKSIAATGSVIGG